MISRVALYHRWRRFQVTSLAYPISLAALMLLAMAGLCLLSLQ